MEFLYEIAKGVVGSLITALFFSPAQAPPPLSLAVTPIVEEHDPPVVPSFVTTVPSGHFAGISAPCNSLAEARKSAVSDVVRQILGSVGVTYGHRYLDLVSGSAQRPRREISDHLDRRASGIVLDVERNIVESSWDQDGYRYVYYVLVLYPDRKQVPPELIRAPLASTPF